MRVSHHLPTARAPWKQPSRGYATLLDGPFDKPEAIRADETDPVLRCEVHEEVDEVDRVGS